MSLYVLDFQKRASTLWLSLVSWPRCEKALSDGNVTARLAVRNLHVLGRPNRARPVKMFRASSSIRVRHSYDDSYARRLGTRKLWLDRSSGRTDRQDI